SSEQKGSRADRGRATRPPYSVTQPIHQHGIQRCSIDALTAGNDQRVYGRFNRGQRIRDERYAGRGVDALIAWRYEPDRVRPRFTRLGHEVVRGRKHLQRARYIKQLHGRIGENFNCAGELRRISSGFWRHLESMPGYPTAVHSEHSYRVYAKPSGYNFVAPA